MGVDTYQSLPKTLRHPASATTATASTAAAPTMGSPQAPRNLPSDYKYAQDRLSHFRMTTDERVASREGMVWQLYEWQQRQQFRHGSPTAPIYSGPDYLDSAGASFRVTLEVNPYVYIFIYIILHYSTLHHITLTEVYELKMEVLLLM